jgi:hypothetical protein
MAISVDGVQVGGVKNGGEARFEVRPGKRSFEITLGPWMSKQLVMDLPPGQHVSLVCGVSALTGIYVTAEGGQV